MTPAQTTLLRELIRLDREYRTKLAKGEPASNDDRGIEVSWSCSRRTANVLCELELAEIVSFTATQSRIFLGKYAPHD